MVLDSIRLRLIESAARLDMREFDEVLIEAVDRYLGTRPELVHLSTLNDEERSFLQNLTDTNSGQGSRRVAQDIYPSRQWSNP